MKYGLAVGWCVSNEAKSNAEEYEKWRILVEERQTKMNIKDDVEPNLKALIFHY